MSSKQQFKDVIKRDKELIRTLTTRNEVLERELSRVRNILSERGIQPTKVTLKPCVKKKWWQFWK